MSDFPEVVVLAGGVSVAREALALALNLEARGCRFRIDQGELVINPRPLLTGDDRAQIQTWIHELKRIVHYAIGEREELAA